MNPFEALRDYATSQNKEDLNKIVEDLFKAQMGFEQACAAEINRMRDALVTIYQRANQCNDEAWQAQRSVVMGFINMMIGVPAQDAKKEQADVEEPSQVS